MSDDPIHYLWTDAWLLLSILIAPTDGPADLRSIIAAGDYIDRSIFRPEELESGHYRLTRGGHVEEINGGFVPTQATRDAYERIARETRILRRRLKTLKSYLGVRPHQPGEPIPDPENQYSYPGLVNAPINMSSVLGDLSTFLTASASKFPLTYNRIVVPSYVPTTKYQVSTSMGVVPKTLCG